MEADPQAIVVGVVGPCCAGKSTLVQVLLARGYQFLRQLHADRRADFYLTTIADENRAAIRLLTSGRAELPVYNPWGRYITLAIRPRPDASAMGSNHDGLHFRTATIADRDILLVER